MNKNYAIILTVLMAAVFICAVVFFLINDNSRPCGDEARKLLVSLRYYHAFSSGGINVFRGTQLFSPLYFLMPSFICFILGGFSYKVCAGFNILYYLMTIVCTYQLAMIIRRNRCTAVLSVFILSFFNFFFLSYSRLSIMEFALCSFVCMSILFLLKTDYFRNSLYSLLFSLSLAAGILIKYTFVIYIIGPLCIYMVFSLLGLRKAGISVKIKASKNFFYSFLLGSGVGCLFTIPFLDFHAVTHSYFQTLEFESSIHSLLGHFLLFGRYLAYALWSPIKSVSYSVQIPLGIIILTALFCFLRKIGRKYVLIFLAYFFTPLVILATILRNEESRYFIPVIPALSIIIACGLTLLNKWLRAIFTTSVIFAVIYLFISHGMYLRTTMNAQHPIGKMLLHINKQMLLENKQGHYLLAVNARHDSLIDVIEYFALLYNVPVDILELRKYIRNGTIVRTFDNELLKKIATIKYVVSDYANPADIVLVKNQRIINPLQKKSQFRYDDALMRLPVEYWPYITLYEVKP
ncbi:MAG: glycosyltransferase family 39 protein [Candidatus Omnitrophota bacterium]